MADFVAKVGCCRSAVGHFVENGRIDLPTLTLFTRLQHYATHKARSGGGRATSEASRRRF